MTQPSGFRHPSLSHHICKLNKALYGLKQAPCAWFARLTGKLLTLGFQASRVDSSLFTYHFSLVTMYVLIYVDDIIITGTQSHAIDHLLQQLRYDFVVKDVGSLNFFLSVEVLHRSDGILLS